MNQAESSLACDCRGLTHEQLSIELAKALCALLRIKAESRRMVECSLDHVDTVQHMAYMADNAIHNSRLAHFLLDAEET